MGDAGVVEDRAFGDEAEAFVERDDGDLGVEEGLLAAEPAGGRREVVDEVVDRCAYRSHGAARVDPRRRLPEAERRPAVDRARGQLVADEMRCPATVTSAESLRARLSDDYFRLRHSLVVLT